MLLNSTPSSTARWVRLQRSKVFKYRVRRASIVGIVVMGLGRYLVVGDLHASRKRLAFLFLQTEMNHLRNRSWSFVNPSLGCGMAGPRLRVYLVLSDSMGSVNIRA